MASISAPVRDDRPLIQTLDELRERAEYDAVAKLEKLIRSKRLSVIVARTLRIFTLTFIAGGVLAPFVGGAFPRLRTTVDFAGLGLLLVVLGGALTALDRFGGFSAAWIRYAELIAAIQHDLTSFRVEWAVGRSEAERSSLDDLSRLAESLIAFASTLASRSAADTPPWIPDVRAAFPLDRPAPARQEKPKQKPETQPAPSRSSVLSVRDESVAASDQS
jgi:hypothetical protein